MSDDVKDLLDRAAADSLLGIHLDLPTVHDVARSEAPAPGTVQDGASGPDAQIVPLERTPRRARWPLGLAAAVLAILAIGGGLLAVQSADDRSPATPTTVPASDARRQLRRAIDASVAEVFEVHYSEVMEARLRAASGGVESTVNVWDGDKTGGYVNRPDGPSPITMIVDGTTVYFQTGPDLWVSTAASVGRNPLRDFGQRAESSCVFDRDGQIIVDLVDGTGSMPPRDRPEQTPCGSASGLQYQVTLDGAGRIATIRSGDRDDSLTMTRFEYPDIARLRLPDASQVTERPNAVGTRVDPATGYWTVQEVDPSSVGPTTTVTSPP